MSNFVEILKNLDGYVSLQGVTSQAVSDAEDALSLKFSKEYRDYLIECGVASADGHEFTGIANSKRLNVVDVTIAEKEKNPVIPKELYVVERTQIDGLIIWQSVDGTVFQSVGATKPERICASLSEYLQ